MSVPFSARTLLVVNLLSTSSSVYLHLNTDRRTYEVDY